ncbi:MAG: 1,4-beta-xylanase [Limimaricola sp.]|uniref:hypothetical protein n=1 Tax=Limimaricola sp. TaxID=2211665 RepID=UPI001DEAEF99|nr:hypothetical protein [Limimaricola sp.]MBI1415964.1 1,4-beta-xylanase [Limimaricola sp.]
MTRWTPARARAWAAERPWVCGFNYLPSTAVNFLEMWQAETFDRATILRELGWAAEIGFNALRVNLHTLVWQHDRDGLAERFNWLLDAAARAGLQTVPCLFDDCGFGGDEPAFGPQPEPIPGVHNSRAVASPGRAALSDPDLWPVFEGYVRDIVGRFAADPRILFWDIYNEPGNRMIFHRDGAREHEPDFTPHSLALMRAAFDWAREARPIQPLTVAAWTTPAPGVAAAPYQTEVDREALALSDIVTFHAYWDSAHVAGFIDHLAALERPMFCTEWMARPVGSRIADQLTLFKARGVGAFQWGLVAGRTQTTLPWPAKLVAQHGGAADRSVWFHDLLHADGTPYDPAETALIRRLTSADAGIAG